MFIIKLDDRWWPAERIALRYPSGDLIRRFSTPHRLLEFLSRRPRTNYRLEGLPGNEPLPQTFSPHEEDIRIGEIWFDPDQKKIVTN
jgi:hypothetical protein